MCIRQLTSRVLLLVAGTGSLLAQEYTSLSGLIRDPSGASVPAASISVVNENNGFRRLVRSRSNGSYMVASLQPGVYKITVRKEGFRTLIRFGLKLDVAQPVQVDFTLPLGSMREVVTVEGSPPVLNSDDASVGTWVGRRQIDSLPLNGRGLLSLLELAPGTIVTPATRGEPGQFTASGQRPKANYFIVDGVSANTGVIGGGLPAQSTGGSMPGLTAIGSLHGLASLEALEEFRVQTSTATSEFGRLPGAQVLLSSRSGSNDFHGSFFHFFRHEKLDANDWFSQWNSGGRAPLRMHDFGATFAGPLRRNRTFFFLSYEGMRLRQPFFWRAAVPSRNIRFEAPEWVQPLLRLFPLPGGRSFGNDLAEWTGGHNRRAQLDVAGIRVDHVLTPRVTVFARYNGAPSSNEFTSTVINDLRLHSRSLTLGTNVHLSPTAILDLKLNASDATSSSFWRAANETGDSRCFLEPVTEFFFRTGGLCDYLFRFHIGGIGQLYSGRESDQRQMHLQAVPSATLTLGGHQVRLGADYRRIVPIRRDNSPSLSIISERFADLLTGEDLWTAFARPLAIRSVLSEVSAFVQDTWRVHTRLTASFGLRWEYARSPELLEPFRSSDPLTAYTFPGQSLMWQSGRGNFAPRLGVAYKPFRQDQTVIRAGWGLFYDSSLSLASDLVNGGPLSVALFTNARSAPFSTVLGYGFTPGLRLPAVEQWNVTMERALSGADVLSMGYVGSSAQRLIRREFGGFEMSQTLWLALATNHGASNYHGLQVQYRRAMARGVQALASYAWSHSIDNSSSDSLLHRTATMLSAKQDRGPSDFDVRQAFTLALTYETGKASGRSLKNRLLAAWAVDSILRARTGFPITVLNSEYSMGLAFANAFRPDLVAGRPIWLSDPAVPGARRLNRAAFQETTGLVQGNLGRNAIRGFGMHQIDLALRRQFTPAERLSVEFRLEAFNLLNHPNFADPVRFLSSPLFGESPSMLNLMLGTGSPSSGVTPIFQTGGPRSVQLGLRFRF